MSFPKPNDLLNFPCSSLGSAFLIAIVRKSEAIVVIHRPLQYKLTCGVDLIIGQAILTCFMLGGRVGKDTKRSLKGKNIELIITNIWN